MKLVQKNKPIASQKLSVKNNQHQKTIKSEDSSKLTVVKCAVWGIIVAVFMSNPFFNYHIVEADGIQTFTGSENADNEKDFDNRESQHAWKTYSVLRGYGFTREQAVGILGNAMQESGIRADKIEGDYYSSLQAICGVDEIGPRMCQNFEPVSEEYCKKLVEIEPGTYPKGYEYPFGDGTGHYYCGLGLFQWTNYRAGTFMRWCTDNRVSWWEADVQLTFMLTDTTEQQKMSLILEKGGSLDDAVSNWLQHFEGHDPSWGSWTTEKTKRLNYALDLLDKFPETYDVQYANKILSGAGLKGVHRRDGIYDKSILHEYASPAIVYPWNAGILTSNNTEQMEENNQNVWNGYIGTLQGTPDTQKPYSLFELYGEDIHWMRYLGESTVAPTIGDHIYSGVTQGKKDQLIGEIVGKVDYQPADYLSTQIYEGRPRCLTWYEVWQGYTDPRATAELGARFTGYFYVSGSFSLGFAKLFQSLICLLLGDELLVDASDALTAIETSDEFQAIRPAINVMFVFAILALIVSLVKNVIKYARGAADGAPPYAVITRSCVAFLTAALILACVNNPAALNAIIVKGLGGIDEYFNASLAQVLEDDEVIAVTDDSMATRAAIWKTCIFEPWCRGQFNGLEYEELYTNYATLEDGQSRMPQSNQHVDDVADGDLGKPYYNSTELTGDVYVYVGGGKKIRNWAAFLYSCGSKYHIDATLTSSDQLEDATGLANFPNAKTSAYDSGVYADTFRVIDAQMNISPEYYADGEVIRNYSNSKKLENHFLVEGAVVIINALMLVWFVPAIYQKLKNFIILIVTCFQCIYYGFIELFKENYGLKNLGATLKKALFEYFIANIKIYIMVILYMNFVDKGFVKMIIYCILCLTVLCLTLSDVTNFVTTSYHNIKERAQKNKAIQRLSENKQGDSMKEGLNKIWNTGEEPVSKHPTKTRVKQPKNNKIK